MSAIRQASAPGNSPSRITIEEDDDLEAQAFTLAPWRSATFQLTAWSAGSDIEDEELPLRTRPTRQRSTCLDCFNEVGYNLSDDEDDESTCSTWSELSDGSSVDHRGQESPHQELQRKRQQRKDGTSSLPSPLQEASDGRRASPRRVRFSDNLVSEVRTRPRTTTEEWGELFYTSHELQKFWDDYAKELRAAEASTDKEGSAFSDSRVEGSKTMDEEGEEEDAWGEDEAFVF